MMQRPRAQHVETGRGAKPRRAGRAAALALVTCTLLAATAPAGAVPRYRVENLGYLRGSYASSIAVGINARGDVVGWSGSGPTRAFRYTDGTGMAPLRGSAAFPSGCAAYEINDSGVVAGSCGRSPVHAFRWSPTGVIRDLGDMGGGLSQAFALSNGNIVVGQGSVSGQYLQQAFRHNGSAAGMGDITPGNGESLAHDINNQPRGAQITGWENSVAFRWRGGVMTSLGAPAGYAYSYGFGINDAGTVVGSARELQVNVSRYARYTDGKGWQILTGVSSIGSLRAVNNAGVAVGTGRSTGGGEAGMIYTEGAGIQELNSLIDRPRSWSIVGAYDINDAGQIAAQGMILKTGEFRAVRLTPIEQ